MVLEVALPSCASEDLGDEILALNVETGVYFSIRGLGAAVWRDLAAGHPAAALAEQVRQATGDADAVRDLTEQLRTHGLMRESGRPPAESEPAILQLLRSGEREVVFEVFDDMKDLILSDPIHDVDQAAGWPTLRTADE